MFVDQVKESRAIHKERSEPPCSMANRSILLSGWYGVDNAGDEAILQQFIHEFVDKEKIKLSVLSEQPARILECYSDRNVQAVFHCTTFGRSSLKSLWKGECRQIFNAVRRADLFVLGGGGIIRDNTSWRNVIRLLDELWLAKLLGKPTALYAVGVGPFRTRCQRWLIAQTLKRCDLITVREESSGEQLEAIGIPKERIVVVADPALLLTAEPVKDTVLRKHLTSLASQERVLGLFVHEDDTPVLQLAKALDRLHEHYGFRFVSLPMRCHERRDDRQAARKVQLEMKHPEAMELVETALTASEIKWLAGRFSLNITVRLHALIFSLAMKTPAVAINYEPKVANLLKSFGLESCEVNCTGDVEEQVVKKVLECSVGRAAYIQHIQVILPERLEAASHTFTLLRRLMANSILEQETE
jgi:polysaccharide pyruvyl transferase CsaB